MTLKYQSGRVSRLGVGVPGFTESGDLTLDVSGSLGIGTTQPRAEADVPRISIRGDLIDSGISSGGLGYFLSQDDQGVRWVAASPLDLTFVRVFDDGVQVGLSSFTGLNFVGAADSSLVTVRPNATDVNLADIVFDTQWIRTQYGDNSGLSTGFGPDGTYASLPGFGTSEAIGITSVGIGTNNPQDDFQVGIGSTGVQINGPLGKVDAQIIKAKNVEIDGNITVESLVVSPGIATLTFLEVIEDATIPIEYVGFSSIRQADIAQLNAEQTVSGLTTVGANGEDTFVLGDLYVNGGLGTFIGDVFIGGDLTVDGTTFFKQINAENIAITGIATINEVDANVGFFTSLDITGITTTEELDFTTGIGSFLELGTGIIGVGSFGETTIGITTIGFASITDATVTGILTITDIDAEDINVDRAVVGILTVGAGLTVGGASTFVGIATFQDDVFVDGDLSVRGDLEFEDLFGKNLVITGIGTIVNLVSDVGIITSLQTENQINSGVSTSSRFVSQTLDVGVGTIASIFATEIDADRGRIGILTGDLISYGIGTFGTAVVGIATVGIITGDQLFYYGNSQINGATFLGDRFIVDRNVEINSGVTTINTGGPGVGFATFSDDVYVGNDLFVAGELTFDQLTGNNLLVTGIGTINQLEFTTGIGTDLEVDTFRVGTAATIRSLFGTDADIDTILNDVLTVQNFADIRGILSRNISVTRDPLDPFSGRTSTVELRVSEDATINNLTAEGQTQIDLARIDVEDVGISTIQWLTVTGIATINEIDFQEANGGALGVGTIVAGVGSFGSISIGNTVGGDGTIINEDGIITENGDFSGILTATTGIITSLFTEQIDSDNVLSGVSTIGFASITDSFQGVSTIGFADVTDLNVGVGTVGILTVTDFLYSTGVSTFVGVTSIFGSAVVDGDLTVTGITTFNQLDADQSQIGILTVKTILDANGIINAEDVVIEKDLRVLGFSSFTGFATFTDALFDDITTGILSVTEQAYFENIYQSPTGIATLNVVGINSALIDQTTIGVATVGFGSFTSLFAENANISGIITAKGEITVEGEVSITGIATIDQLNVTGIATIAREEVGFSSIGIATIQEADIEDLDVETFRVGTYATIGRPGAANTEVGIMSVTGISTFVGLVTTKGDLFVDGSLFVTGIQSIPQLNAAQAIIGILTVTNYIDTEDFFQQPTGFSTLSNFSFPTGIGSTLTVGFATFGDASVSGVVTIAQDLRVERNLQVLGISTLGSASTVTGFTTTLGDLYVGGDLYVRDDIFKDEITGRNMLLTGIATIQNLNVPGIGTVTDIFGENLDYEEGLFDNIQSTDITTINLDADVIATGILTSNFSTIGVTTAISINVADLGVTNSAQIYDLAVTNDTLLNNLEVTTTSQFDGDANFDSNVSVGGTVGVGNSVFVPFIETDTIKAKYIETDEATVGLATITQLDVSDTTTVKSFRAVTTNTVGTVVQSYSGIDYSSFEFTIQSKQGNDVQASKIHGVVDSFNGAVYWNEYSLVYSNELIAEFDIIYSAGDFILLIENISTAPLTSTVTATLTRS